MIIEILEARFPEPFDRKQVEDWVNNVAQPADQKAGCKMIRSAWTHTGGPMKYPALKGEVSQNSSSCSA